MSTNNYIKHQGPRKNSKFHQGVIDPKKCRKYFDSCKNEPIIYRSGLEYNFIQFCENYVYFFNICAPKFTHFSCVYRKFL